MFDKKFFLGVALVYGVIFVIGINVPEIGAYIPPTPALRDIFVQTSPWFGEDTLVQATNSSDRVYFVSDGSILFNVTETYP